MRYEKIEVTDSIPIPPAHKPKGIVRLTIESLKVGQSFILPERVSVQSAFTMANAEKIKIRTRTTPDGVRLWRIA